MTTRACRGLAALAAMLCLAVMAPAHAGECFINKEIFAVANPDMVTRVCFLWRHALQYKPGSESELTIASPETLHHDPLQAEYYRLLLDKKFVSLKRSTPVYDCGYDLKTLVREPAKAQLLGLSLPRYNCFGAMSSFVPVRPVSESRCYWAALESVECRETVPDTAGQLQKELKIR